MEELLAEVGIQGADFSQSIEHPIPETSVLKQGPRPTAFEGAVLPFEDLEVDRRAAGTPESEDLHVLYPPSVSGSGDGSPASEPIISAAEEQLDTEISGDCMMEAEGDPAVLAMLAARDAEGMTTASGDVISIAVEDTTAGVDSGGCGPVKRKRGRPRKNPETPAAVPAKKKEHEDVCFVCFDRTNQNLVSCNRRGCYKAYHPVCVGRDADFFRSKGKWNCGWHICSSCQKAAHYMCYTCTTSYCKVCITGESKYVSVRGTHGFCQSCHNTVTLIELNKLAFEKEDGLNFVDTDSFTYLFKAYWLDLKGKLSMTSEELNNARHPFFVAQSESSDELYDANADQGFSSESSLSDSGGNIASKKKGKRNSQAFPADKNFSKEIDVMQTTMPNDTGWASKELLELVAHMRNGDQSFISQFDVQALLLEYIKKYNLRDPRRKSQIVCDLRLQNLFGKQRVGHFEMLKLLESHFLATEAAQGVTEGIPVETLYPDYKLSDDGEDGDILARVGSQKKRKNRKKAEREIQNNVDDYAAVDVHNINLIFLRRSLVEELLDDIKTFNDKVVGSFVRIKISNAGQRQDLYRLVQVVGTHESSKPYKVGKKTTDIMLEILNLDKKETSSIDSISNQEFTEEECQRLRQSIKCGLINRLKVGYIQEKAMVLHAVRVNDSLESEKLRLNHLRDRASETGRRKELRECVEKLQLLNSPEERRRRLTEVPEIHADPKMDPEYQSSEGEDDKGQDYILRAKEDAHKRKDRELILRGKLGNNWSSMHKSPNSQWESGRRMQSEVRKDRFDMYDTSAERSNEFPQNQSQEVPKIQIGSTESHSPRSLGQLNATMPEMNLPALGGSFPCVPNEVEKIWHYQDPSKNVQGPFSLAQLRKWNATGYFPPDLRIWRTSQKMEHSQLLMDVLGGKCYKEPQEHVTQHSSFTHQLTRTDSQQSRGSRESIPNHHLHIPTFGTGDHGVGGGSGWNQKEDNGNTWSPTRPMIWKPGDIPESAHLSSVLPAVSASFNAHAINGSESKYRIIESECPSPTPRLEMKESPLLPQDGDDTANKWSNMLNRPEDPPTSSIPVGNLVINHSRVVPAFQATGPSSTSDTGIFLDSTNSALADGFRKKDLGNGMQKLDSSNSSSSEFQTNLSPIMSSADDRFSAFGKLPGQALEFSSQKSESAKQELVLASVPKQISVGHNPSPPQLPRLQHDQAQIPKPGLPPISQTSQEIEGSVECSLPSPTPGSNNNAGSASENQNVVNAPTLEYNNSGWAVPGSTSWGTPAYGHPKANKGWGTSLQGNTDENKGWGSSGQLCADGFTPAGATGHWNGNSNASWGTVVQGNTDVSRGWGTPVNGNSNSHTGWGTMPLETANANSGLGLAAQGNGWGSSLGSCDGGWKSSDTSRWRSNNEGNDAKLHLRHSERDMGRCGGKFQPGGRVSFQPHRGSPGGNGHRGVCKFYENGHCKKGRSCNYLHS